MRLPNIDPISNVQKDIIVGSILGDGCLEFDGFHGTRLQIKQSEKYKNYVFWLYDRLKNICNSPPKQRPDNRQWYFSTKHLKDLTNLQRLFYVSKKKCVPCDIAELLTSSLSLAIWYMDDGTLDWRPKNHYAFTFNTDCFSLDDTTLLVKVLKMNFGIEASTYTALCRGKKYAKIYIGAKGRDKFLSLINPHILDCFIYKLPPL